MKRCINYGGSTVWPNEHKVLSDLPESLDVVLTIGDSDSSGGAGIQADLQTFQNLGVRGCSIMTAITAHNEHEITTMQPMSVEYITAQLSALSHFPKIIKLGMLARVSTIEIMVNFLRQYTGKVILDPTMLSAFRKELLHAESEQYLHELRNLFPYVEILTLTIPETESILGRTIHSYHDIENAGHEFLAMGLKSVFIKGSHLEHNTLSQDYWTNGTESYWLSGQYDEYSNDRGMGCVFSAAMSASLALGYPLKDAIIIAKMYIGRGIRLAQSINASTFITHAGWPEDEIDLPCLSDCYHGFSSAFSDCGRDPIGLYPVVDHSDWLRKLLPLGVNMIQLRIKGKFGHELENEIKQSIEIANKFDARLFINDYWELAIAYGAYGVHLGQEDLDSADVKKIYQANLRLGLSTHCYYEVARAHAFKPSYIACGPIYSTPSKRVSFSPVGIDQLTRWRKTLSSYRLIAIGGINQARIPTIMETGVDGVAMISAITQADNPTQMTIELLQMMNAYNNILNPIINTNPANSTLNIFLGSR